MPHWPGIVERYRPLLDLPAGVAAITLLEGDTPLVPLPRVADELGAGALFIKYEGLNPTGSFKDRGMTAAVSAALHRGARAVVCASTGNTAASAAAYAARADLRCLVVIPEGKVAVGKLAGAIAYGAQVLQIAGSFDDALSLVRSLADRGSMTLVNSINPLRLEGQKTAAFEICDHLGRAPDWLALPVGNAGNITAYWLGFRQYHRHKGTGLPRVLGVQAAGAAPLVLGHAVEHPETVATAIRIGRPARGEQAQQAADESQGRIVAVSDEAILSAQQQLAAEGIWVEPAAAAGIAGLAKEISEGRIDLRAKTAVCVCTGHGLKDPAVITDRFPAPEVIPADLAALEEALGAG
jgi:threonine synthase